MISQKESHIVTIQKMLAFLLSFPWPPWLPMAPLWQVSSSPPRTAWRGHEPLQAILFGRSKCQAVLRPPRFGWRFKGKGCNQCVPSGKHTKSYGICFPLKIVIFHSYVKLPEGNQPNSDISQGKIWCLSYVELSQTWGFFTNGRDLVSNLGVIRDIISGHTT